MVVVIPRLVIEAIPLRLTYITHKKWIVGNGKIESLLVCLFFIQIAPHCQTSHSMQDD